MIRNLKNLSAAPFDMIVIGGGITGAAVAYEAASRGLAVALFERGDFCQGTSAASSKMIHGGMRYLGNGEFGLVRESLRERRIMENIAPNFVYPRQMMLPHYRHPRRQGKWVMKTGMVLYDLLSWDRNRTWDPSKRIPLHRSLPPEEALHRQPVLTAEGLTGASLFHDCLSVCPERLALAFIKSAVRHGARVANYAPVEGFRFGPGNGRIEGVMVRDLLTGTRHAVAGRMVVNCAGPWADRVLGLARKNGSGASLRRSEGIHIITPRISDGSTIITAMTPDERHCFLIPWRGHTLIGTTDTLYTGSPDDYRVTRGRILELIDTVNATFAPLSLRFADVLYAYGGLRPLVESPDVETYRASRRHEIYDNEKDGLEGLLTVEGGKWTTSRHLADRVVTLAARKTGMAANRSISASQYLYGSEIPHLPAFLKTLQQKETGFSRRTLDTLGRLYGTECHRVLDLARSDSGLAESLEPDGEIMAQVLYAVRYEMAMSLGDIVLRRTGIATLGDPGRRLLGRVAGIAATELGWDDARIDLEIEQTRQALRLPE